MGKQIECRTCKAHAVQAARFPDVVIISSAPRVGRAVVDKRTGMLLTLLHLRRKSWAVRHGGSGSFGHTPVAGRIYSCCLQLVLLHCIYG